MYYGGLYKALNKSKTDGLIQEDNALKTIK